MRGNRTKSFGGKVFGHPSDKCDAFPRAFDACETAGIRDGQRLLLCQLENNHGEEKLTSTRTSHMYLNGCDFGTGAFCPQERHTHSQLGTIKQETAFSSADVVHMLRDLTRADLQYSFRC